MNHTEAPAAEDFGRDVLGPIVAEFCLRLWALGSLMEHRTDTAMLFCARGGLRMALAYERFLTAAELPSPVHLAPLMVSRVVAIRSPLVRVLHEDLDALPPSSASALLHEFPRTSLSGVSLAISGIPPARSELWSAPFTTRGFATLLKHSDGQRIVDSLVRDSNLFTQHLLDTLGGRRHAMIIDTGLYGTTRQLLAEGHPDINFSSALIVRSYRQGAATRHPRTVGLSVQAGCYSPLSPRTSVLRYWQFVEWLFEPDLPSVRTFSDDSGEVRSNLEVEGWQGRVDPSPGTAFAGILAYIDALPVGPAERVAIDADRAWRMFRRAIVWPNSRQADALSVGARSYDFGNGGTWAARPWRGPVAALRGYSMWREGEIAKSGFPLRLTLLAALEAAHGIRYLKRTLIDH